MITTFYLHHHSLPPFSILNSPCPILLSPPHHYNVCVSVCVCVLVAELCPTLCDPMDCSLPGSPVHGILQARKLEWVANSFSKGSS